jgi:Helix-turn-helix domain
MSGPRFSIIPAGAVTDTRLEPRDLQVLCLLGRHTDDSGWCSRSQVKMARELKCGRATVQRAIGRLVEAGWLQHRPTTRRDGGDCSHDYRVMLDQPAVPAPPVPDGPQEARSEATGAQDTPLPTGGQGVPALDGQGVPTHERAPIGTTPLNEPLRNENERERASAGDQRARSAERSDQDDQDQIPDADLFERFRRWPTFAADSQVRIANAWAGLTHDERREAERAIEAYLEFLKSVKRSTVCAAQTYLAEKRWEALPPDKRSRPATTQVHRLSREFLALAIRLIGEGRPLAPLAEAMKPGKTLSWPVDEVPAAADIAGYVQAHSPTMAGFAWCRWFAERGLDLGLDPSDPDTSRTGGARAAWLWVPTDWPPEWDAARAERELAALAERERAERQAAVENWERTKAEMFGNGN